MNDITKNQNEQCQLDTKTEKHEKIEITLNILEDVLGENTYNTTCGDYNL